MIDAWLKPLQDSQDSAGSLTTSSYVTVMLLNMPTIYVRSFFQRCADKQIALNLNKCHFFQTQVTFAGFQLSGDGYQVPYTAKLSSGKTFVVFCSTANVLR